MCEWQKNSFEHFLEKSLALFNALLWLHLNIRLRFHHVSLCMLNVYFAFGLISPQAQSESGLVPVLPPKQYAHDAHDSSGL